MKWLLFIAVVLGLIAAALIFADHQTTWATVRFTWGDTSFATNFVVVLLAGVALLIVLRLIGALLGLPVRLVQVWRDRRLISRRQAFAQGVSLYLQGRREQARKRLLRAAQAHGGHFAPTAALLAAYCALRDGQFRETRAALQTVHQKNEDDGFCAALIEAEMQLESGQVEQAAKRLAELRRRQPDNHKVAELLARACARLGDWDALVESLPQLRRLHANRPDRLHAVEASVEKQRLQRVADRADQDELRRRWRKLGGTVKPALLADYARMLARVGAPKEAEQLLREAIEAKWDEDDIVAYGDIGGDVGGDVEGGVDERLQHAERWLASKPENPALLLCLGKIYRQAGLWDQARHCLKKSLILAPSAEVCRELAVVFERIGEGGPSLAAQDKPAHQA